MEYQKFVEEVKKQVERMKQDAIISIYKKWGNNDTVSIGLQMEIEENIAPVIYLEEFYERYEWGKEIFTIAEEVIKIYEECKRNPPIIHKELFQFDNIKDHIIYEVINAEKSKNFLQDKPYIQFLDLALVFKVLYLEENQTYKVTISNDHMHKWGMTKEELCEYAERNTETLLPVCCKNMSEVIGKVLSEKENDSRIYILTNQTMSAGAGAMFYKDVLKKFAEKYGSFYILPSSIHEVLLYVGNDEERPELLEEIVKDINCNVVKKEEVLSNRVYFYDQETNTIQ